MHNFLRYRDIFSTTRERINTAIMAEIPATPSSMTLEEKLDKIRMPKLQNQQQVRTNLSMKNYLGGLEADRIS